MTAHHQGIDDYRVWDILLPKGGLIVIYQAYADASGINGPTLTVANFMFEKDKADALNEEWARLLHPFVKHLPRRKQYFNMGDFYTRKDPWAYLTEGQRAALERELIDSAHKYMEQGAVASIKQSDYKAEVTNSYAIDAVGSPFLMCNISCMYRLAAWVEKFRPNDEIAYAFEDGDADKEQLDIRLAKIEASAHLRSKYKYYSGRTFLAKHNHHALGAADLLAWEFRHGIEGHFADPAAPPRPFLDVLFHKRNIGGQHFAPFEIKFWHMSQALERANVWAEEREAKAEVS